MTIRVLPQAPNARPMAGLQTAIMPRALDRWNTGLKAADAEGENTISIYDSIGYDYWTGEGVTAKRIAGALRSFGKGAVTVNINSPGGDVFEGLAIYNLLRDHPGEITVKILGLAASAASVIAMAGDKIQIARSAFLMIHNSWSVAVGNRNDMREFADWLEPFDRAIADIYSARTGIDQKTAIKMMDAETWMGGNDAIKSYFADELLAADGVSSGDGKTSAHAVRRLELALRSSGMPKQDAMTLISEFKASVRDAAEGERDATVVKMQLEPLPKMKFTF